MNTVITIKTIEPSETSEASENEPDAWQCSAGAPRNRLRGSLTRTVGDQGILSGETGCSNTDECTYETDETEEIEVIKEKEEAEEPKETEELEERKEVNDLSPELWFRIYEAISECEVSNNRNINRPLFMLAHKLRTIEEELKVRFSIGVTADIVKRWEASHQDQLEDGHDYLAELLDKLSLVRYPKGRALVKAVEVARGLTSPSATRLLSPDVQVLANLCKVLQQQAGEKPLFLDGQLAELPRGSRRRWALGYALLVYRVDPA